MRWFLNCMVGLLIFRAHCRGDEYLVHQIQIAVHASRLNVAPDSCILWGHGGAQYHCTLTSVSASNEFVPLWIEVRWLPSLNTMVVFEKVCFEFDFDFHTCMSLLVKESEGIAELGSSTRFGTVNPHIPLVPQGQQPDLVLVYRTGDEIAIPSTNDEYASGPRAFQINVQMLALEELDATTSRLLAAGLKVDQASPDELARSEVLVVEFKWKYPQHSIAELVARFGQCMTVFPFASLTSLYTLLAGMNRYGPSASKFTLKVQSDPPYIYNFNPHLRIDACSSDVDGGDFASFGWDFPHVRFFPGEEEEGAHFMALNSWSEPPNMPLPPPPPLSTGTDHREIAELISEPHSDPLVAVVLIVYKRSHLAEQIAAIASQSLARRFVVYVCQNENHVDVRPLLEMLRSGVPDPTVQQAYAPHAATIHLPLPFDIHHIHSPSYNQKYHGRFAFLNMVGAEYVALFDDDKIPGPRWVEHALGESRARAGIVGYSGRLWVGSKWYHVPLYRTAETVQVDYVGQCWVFKSSWIRYMWQDRPVDVENAEDMQFSAQALIHGGVRTYIASQPVDMPEVWCDSKPSYGIDKVSSSISSNSTEWMRERSGILNYMIVARGFVPLLYRAPYAAFHTLAQLDLTTGESGYVSEAEMARILGAQNTTSSASVSDGGLSEL